jgi:hypothetical protein
LEELHVHPALRPTVFAAFVLLIPACATTKAHDSRRAPRAADASIPRPKLRLTGMSERTVPDRMEELASYKVLRRVSMFYKLDLLKDNAHAQGMADVTLVLDNTDRTAPAALNTADVLEVTRRIEREEGSVYRVNGREVRARDVQLLFADASTGAHSPALVRQGQIGELIAAKPVQRR